jgi:hypothetical protein
MLDHSSQLQGEEKLPVSLTEPEQTLLFVTDGGYSRCRTPIALQPK